MTLWWILKLSTVFVTAYSILTLIYWSPVPVQYYWLYLGLDLVVCILPFLSKVWMNLFTHVMTLFYIFQFDVHWLFLKKIWCLSRAAVYIHSAALQLWVKMHIWESNSWKCDNTGFQRGQNKRLPACNNYWDLTFKQNREISLETHQSDAVLTAHTTQSPRKTEIKCHCVECLW